MRIRVLVTGGAGFIGANLCRRLAEDPAVEEVRVIDDLSSGSAANLADLPVELVEGSILDPELLRGAVDGCTHVVHLAAVPSVPRSIRDPLTTHEANATGTLRVLEAVRAAGDIHVTVASSSSVYGANPTLPKHEGLQCRPMSPYAVSKLAAEQYAMAYAACYGLRVLPFRFFNVFGPLQSAGHAYAAVVPSFIDAALSGRALVVHGDGGQTRDFTYVGSVVAVMHRALKSNTTSSPVNLAWGTRTSVLELVEMLRPLVGPNLQVEHVAPRDGDVRDSQASAARFRALFPGVGATPLDEALTATVEWFRAQLGAGGVRA